jgi:hypothetical protein
MPETRVDSYRLNEIAELVANIVTQRKAAPHITKLENTVGFKAHEFSADFRKRFLAYLEVITTKSTTDPNDPLPDSMKEPAPSPAPAKEFGKPDLPPLDMNDPLSIWRYTRRNILHTYVIADYILKSGWDYIDRRPVERPMTKDAAEVENTLRGQLIEERFLKDCDSKFIGLLELIYKAFDDWYTSQNNPPKRFGDL